MKRTSVLKKPQLKLRRRLELVRTTIRELSPAQLGRVDGGTGLCYGTFTCPTKSCVGCGCEPYTY